MTAKTSVDVQTHNGFWILVSTILASAMAFIDGSALNVALDALQKDLHATGADLLWVLNAYLLVVAALLLLGGSLGDHFGRKRIFSIGIIIFSVSSIVCGLSPNIGLLIAARAVQGIGGGPMISGRPANISASFSPEIGWEAISTLWSLCTITTTPGPMLGRLF